MCQSDGTWTTPECVYGPDVGRLSNGELIPTGAVGCALNFGSTCPGGEAKITGHRLRYNGQYGDCYCDRRCCRKNVCCFDSTCNEGH
ncbi:somatomedin-B and thrombospondin type-1 domain-containing protein-like [Mercenaria mercenaria]|uniref:somatomedin-B and thrombospondin type-1 domain-containing protein-like n=1 Tax=Mercenaria mercenaria TaxID=6596 RepID=UPI00234F0AB0|nr:somatomedin-B and thrombospondin type-1 domain-containing protein-like [Mercenaria mercenaria]